MSVVRFTLIILAILANFMTGCRKTPQTQIFQWPPTEEAFDSLAIALEYAFHDFAPPEKLLKEIAAMDSITRLPRTDTLITRQMRARTLYWKSRYTYRYGNRKDALRAIHSALAITDSATNRYDWYRFTSQEYITDDDIDLAQQYRHYEDALAYARSLGDEGYQGILAIVLGNLMGNINEHEKALEYYHLCDSLHTRLGFTKLPVKNQINVATTMSYMGLHRESDSILLSLEGHPALEGDTFSQNLIPRNLFAHNRTDTAHLYQAYRQIHDNPRFRYIRGFYCGILAEYYGLHDEGDSLQKYSDLAMADLPYVREHGHRAVIWASRSFHHLYKDQIDSALMCRIIYESYIDSLHRHERTNEVIRLNALEQMRKREAAYSLGLMRRNWMMALVAVALVGAGVVTVLVLNRRHMRQRMRSMASELELEKAKRKIAATAITIEEKDNMLDTLRNELSEMRREGEIREGSARRLESTIKTHLSEHENEETFREMFDVVNPGFTERLRRECPDLAESYVKLACYLLMDLDNKKIATLMNIRPESVRQARWRLRRRLNLPEETTLEEYLRHLNSQ